MAIADKLLLLANTKAELRASLVAIGADITEATLFSAYGIAAERVAVQAILAVSDTFGAYFSVDPQYFYEDSAATIPASVDGVIGAMRSVDGALLAIQDTLANKPVLRITPETGIYWLDSNTATSALTATFATALGSNCTIVRAGPDGVTFQEGVTIGTTYNIASPFGFNGEIMIINRSPTTAEQALLTRYMGWRVPGLGYEILPDPNMENSAAWTPTTGVVLADASPGIRVLNGGSATQISVGYLTPAFAAGTQFVLQATLISEGAQLTANMNTGVAASAYTGTPAILGAEMPPNTTTSASYAIAVTADKRTFRAKNATAALTSFVMLSASLRKIL